MRSVRRLDREIWRREEEATGIGRKDRVEGTVATEEEEATAIGHVDGAEGAATAEEEATAIGREDGAEEDGRVTESCGVDVAAEKTERLPPLFLFPQRKHDFYGEALFLLFFFLAF